MPQTIKDDPTKFCEICGVQMFRKRYGKRLEDRGVFLRRRRCSQKCANTKLTVTKSTDHWRAKKLRAKACAECGSTNRLHVHHKDRNHSNNDQANLITLCASCHLKLHWREDRTKRLAACRRRPAQPCVICGQTFHPRWAKKQTCSPACKATLLSQRTTSYYQRAAARPGASTDPSSTAGN